MFLHRVEKNDERKMDFIPIYAYVHVLMYWEGYKREDVGGKITRWGSFKVNC